LEYAKVRQSRLPNLGTSVSEVEGFAHRGAKLDTVSLDGEKLYLKGSFPSEVVANRVWDIIKQVDTVYSDLHHELATIGGPNQSYSVKSGDDVPKSATASTGRLTIARTSLPQAIFLIPTKPRLGSKSRCLSFADATSATNAWVGKRWLNRQRAG
jgi:hypothetical protein